MRALTLLLATVCLCATADRAAAQLSLAVQMDPTPSPFISDWRSNPNTVRFIVSNPTGSPVSVRFKGFIEGDARGRVAETIIDAPVPPVVIAPGTSNLTAMDIGLLEEGAVRYIGPTRAETQRTGRLPEDTYRLCMMLVGYDAPNTPLSPEACARFEVQLLLPPSLIAPANASEVKARPAFQWSVVPMGRGQFARYELTVVELDPGQTNIANAMQSNIPLITREVTMAVYQSVPADPAFEKGKRYAWRVRAYDVQDRYTFAKGGYSEIWTFTYEPALPPYAMLETEKGKAEGKKPKPGFSQSMSPTENIPYPVLMNATVKGTLYYTFKPSELFVERSVPYMSMVMQQQVNLNRVAGVVVRLIRRYKTVPANNFPGEATIRDETNGKTYHNIDEVMATTHTNAQGEFTFQFIETQHTLLANNATIRIGTSTEFSQRLQNASLYKYYVVEVVNPYYCTSGTQIACDPGDTREVSLTSLVRTYNLRVRVQDKTKNEDLGNRVNVYIARGQKSVVPVQVPDDEGQLAVPPPNQPYIAQMQHITDSYQDPTVKYYSSNEGYVIGMQGTTVDPLGSVTFTRLVRNIGGSDGYWLSGMTPQTKPDGNTNELYFHPNYKAKWIAYKSKYSTDGDMLDPGYDYSNEVVYNKSYTIPTFDVTLKMTPKKPRIFGQVQRSDSRKPLHNVLVILQTEPENPPDLAPGQFDNIFLDWTDEDGRFVVENIDSSSSMWQYKILFLKEGYKRFEKLTPLAYGYQYDLGPIYIDPKLTVTRLVVDEDAKPLAGVEGVLGDGARHYTDVRGVFLSPAIPGYQPFYLQKRPKYADKDTDVVLQDSQFELLGALTHDAIVMFEAKRRLQVRVLDPDLKPVKGAVVVLEDFYTPPPSTGGASGGGGGMMLSTQIPVATFTQMLSPYMKFTNDEGYVEFAYKSMSASANVRITAPGTDLIPRRILCEGIPEDGKWRKRWAVLQLGGRVAGVVYVGKRPGQAGVRQTREQSGNLPERVDPQRRELETGGDESEVKKLMKTGQLTEQALTLLRARVPGARVFVEGYPELTAYSNADGEYVIHGVPPGHRLIKATKMPDSSAQYIGDEFSTQVTSGQESGLNMYLSTYNGMDVTKLFGFPIEIEKLTELPGGRIRIDGAFVDIPVNSVFKTRYSDGRHQFVNVELQSTGTGSPPASRPLAGFVRVLDTKVEIFAHTSYLTEMRDGAGIRVEAVGTDYAQGQFRAPCALNMTGWSINTNELKFEDPDGVPVQPFLALKTPSPGDTPDLLLPALTSVGGTFDTKGGALRLASGAATPLVFELYRYHARSPVDSSTLVPDGMHLSPAIMVSLSSCGASMSSTCDFVFNLGDVHVKKSGLEPLDASSLEDRSIALQKWRIATTNFRIIDGYIGFDGAIQAPLIKNVTDGSASVSIPFTGMQLRPDALTGGDFTLDKIDMLGIAKMELKSPLVLSADAESWNLSSLHPEIKATQGPGKNLQGLDPSEVIVLGAFMLRSNATNDISASAKTIIVYQVGRFELTTFQFGFDQVPYMSMLGGLTLIDIPNLAAQNARIYYSPGGVFGMDGVYFQNYIAGGVRLSVASGKLNPDGFKAEGDWGDYKNTIALEGKFKLNMMFWHRKVSGGFSTIAEVINSDHVPPQSQSLFRNTTAPDVKNIYGRTQLEPGLVWTTNLAGWYATEELAGKDSMYYTVTGSGGNGTIAQGNGELKMAGTKGGLGALYLPRHDEFPKGPMSEVLDPMRPAPPEEDGPFSDLTITVDFEQMALIATVQLHYEISDGCFFNGFLETVLSFGSNKFWSFIAAGDGKIDNPVCEGKAVFIAGANYTIPPDRLQLVVDYSISGRPLPDEFKTMNGFFTQVAVVMPIPGTPNFSIDIVMFSLSVACTMGGEARLGLNFGPSTTFFFGVYALAKIEINANATIWFIPIPVALSVKGHLLVAAGAGGYFTYNSDAGASFDITGFILGELGVEGCVTVITEEFCTGPFTVFKIGGEINGRIGNNEYLEITPTFEFLSF